MGVTDLMNMSVSRLREMAMDREDSVLQSMDCKELDRA